MLQSSRRALLGAVAGAAAGGWLGRSIHAAGAARPLPIRIVCLTLLSGPQEVLGRSMLNGAQIAADQINAAGGALGRVIAIVEADIRTDPDRAVAMARALTDGGVNLLCGAVTSDAALAMAPVLQSLGAVLITGAAASEKRTHEAFTANLLRVPGQTCMRNRAQARLMALRYPEVTNWSAIIPDNEYGRSAYAAFRDGLLEAYPASAKRAVRFAEPIVAQFGATAFTAQMATLREGGAEALFIAVYGDDAVLLYRQARRAGLLRRVKVLADSTNEFLVPLGLLNAGHSAVYAYAAAMRRAGSALTTPMIAALEGLTFDTANGSVTLRPEDHQAICDVNFIRIKASTAELTMDVNDYARPDVEIAEFVRYDGASVIEAPGPGSPVTYRSRG